MNSLTREVLLMRAAIGQSAMAKTGLKGYGLSR